MFYGFATDEDSLCKYGKNVCVDDDPRFDFLTYATIALHHLTHTTGIKSLAFQVVFFPRNPPPGTTFDVATSGAKVTLIISICSSVPRSFQRRPTQAAVDHLKQLLGGTQPIWWVPTY